MTHFSVIFFGLLLTVSITAQIATSFCPQHYFYWFGICRKCPVNCGIGGTCDGYMCFCYTGYTFDRVIRQCVPFCTKDCGRNGDCVRPNICQLKFSNTTQPNSTEESKPFESIEIDSTTKPTTVIPDRSNIVCNFKGICTCKKGYKWEEGGCIPDCLDTCLNGKCVGPGQCVCNSGYQMDYNLGDCVPICDEPCENGFCSDRNICTCNEGFQIIGFSDLFKCVPIPEQSDEEEFDIDIRFGDIMDNIK